MEIYSRVLGTWHQGRDYLGKTETISHQLGIAGEDKCSMLGNLLQQK